MSWMNPQSDLPASTCPRDGAGHRSATCGIQALSYAVRPAVGDLAPCGTTVQLGELHEAADLTGAVRLVDVYRNALLPGGADDS